MASAHFPPSSLLTEAIAATQGVYRRQNIKRAAAPGRVRALCREAVLPNSTVREETTLSLAMNPEIREVTILQSPKPTGTNRGARVPARAASTLSCESDTMLKLKSKFCKNQMAIVARKMTVKAL